MGMGMGSHGERMKLGGTVCIWGYLELGVAVPQGAIGYAGWEAETGLPRWGVGTGA